MSFPMMTLLHAEESVKANCIDKDDRDEAVKIISEAFFKVVRRNAAMDGIYYTDEEWEEIWTPVASF